jgi:hypothetical protein
VQTSFRSRAGRVLSGFFRVFCVAAGAFLFLGGPAVAAGPAWRIDIHHAATNFAPGGSGQYWIGVANIGDNDTSGLTTLNIGLPNEVTRDSVRLAGQGASWSCPGTSGDSVIACTTSDSIHPHTVDRNLVVSVDIAAGASGDRFADASVEGGGSPSPATAIELTHIGPEPAAFGIVPGSFSADFLGAGGLASLRAAGAHPDLVEFAFDLNTVSAPTPEAPGRVLAAGSVRDLEVDLPPGFFGNPNALDECMQAQLAVNACPSSSQAGRLDAHVSGGDPYDALSLPVFNMRSPRGSLIDLAAAVTGNPLHLKGSLDPANRYAVKITAADINETAPLFDLRLTLWGVPAGATRPFLTLPSRCGVDQATTLRNYDSWQHSGTYGPELRYEMPGQMTGCDIPRFEPDVEVEPTGHRAGTPTGLDLHLELPQNENPNARGTPPIKRVVATLPRGMTISAAAADGLSACSPAQIGLGSDDPVTCPDSSRLGTATFSTPLLTKPLEGFMYLASQRNNPFQSLLAVYLVVHDTEDRGVLIKLPGRLDLDPVTGQIVTTFDGLPQFPLEELALGFRSGERAPLVSPAGCGSKSIDVEIFSHAQPDDPVDLNETYGVSEGADGGPCPRSPASRPFAPRMEAGTINPSAGAYTPFVFRLGREDQDQELGAVAIDLPPGLSAALAGIPLCSDSALASIPTAEGTGQAELDRPSCPVASQVGTATAAAGAGGGPIRLPGRVYLAGPYRGAPFSLLTVLPALAGPLDLGVVAVRMALHVDPTTAQLRVASDSLPTILSGVPLSLRELSLNLNRPRFTRNPTNCDEMAVSGVVASLQGAVAPVSDRFQVGECSRLGFRPRVSVRFLGPTHRGAHPKFRTVLTSRPGDANIRRVAVTLPGSELLDNRHIGTVCTVAQFNVHRCPAGSIYGRARAWSPLLDRPLEGPIYLRSSSHRLPDLAASVGGEIDLDLIGRVDSVNGHLRNTFAGLPDTPFSKVVLDMQGGRRGLLVNSGGLCASKPQVQAGLEAQNGKTRHISPRVRADCGRD